MRHPILHLRFAALLTALILAPVTLWAAPSESVLKEQPSGIIDDNRQVVGTGPALSVVAPRPSGEAANTSGAQAAVLWLGNFLQQLTVLERDMGMVTQELATNNVALQELRDSIASLQRTREVLVRTGATKNLDFYDKLIVQKQDDLQAIEKEQNSLIGGMKKRWTELNDNLRDKIEESKNLPDFHGALLNLRRNVEQKQELAQMQLHLSAGQSKEFRQLAAKSLDNEALQKPVMLMRIADYIEQGEGRNALYAARLGMQRYPDNATFKALNQSQEVSYLRMLSAKADDDGAAIHKAWNDYAGEVSDSWVKQFFFGSVRPTLDIATGRAYDLELIQKDAVLHSSMAHNGFEVMRRLREKGLSFDEIRGLTPDQLQGKLGLKNPLSSQSAQMFHAAVQTAFATPDVKRLMAPSKEQFDVDLDRSNYDTKAFQSGLTKEEVGQGLLEYAGDGISVKNAILFFGPGAVVGQGTRGALAKFATRLGAEEKAALAAFQAEAETVTASQLISRPVADATAKFLGASQTGSRVLRVMEKAAELRYYELSKGLAAGEGYGAIAGKAIAGTTIGIGEAMAQMKAFEIGGRMGHWAGGDTGEFIVQAGIMLAGNPLEALHGWQTREAAAFEKTAQEMAARRAKWQSTNQLLDNNVRLPIRQAVQQVNAGQALSGEAAQQLDAAIARAEEIGAGAESAVANGPAAQAAAEEAAALASAGKAAKSGNAEAAQMADDIARQQQAAAQAAAAEMEKGGQALEDAARRVKANPPTGEGGAAPESAAPAPIGGGPLEESSWQSAEELSMKFKAGENPPPGPAPPTPPELPKPPKGGTPAECKKLGDEAMKRGNFTEAAEHYRTGFELEKQANKPAYELQYWQSPIEKAEEAARYSEQNAQRALQNQNLAREADKALQPFTEAERQNLKNIKYEDAIPMNEGTAGDPRLITEKLTDGTVRTVGIWKPAGGGRGLSLGNDGQMLAEVLFSRLANRLGLRVPYAEKWTLVKATGELEQGVLMRYVPNTHQLEKLTPGAVLSLKEQIAKFRPLQVLLGNYDVHFGNFLIDEAGRVWAIDAGIAELGTLDAPIDRMVDVIERKFNRALNFEPKGNEVLDYTRLWRDMYVNHPIPKTRNLIRSLDEIMGVDMAKAASDAKQLSPNEFNKLIDEIMPGHPDAQGIKDTYKVRHDHLEELLNERWPDATRGRAGVASLPLPLRNVGLMPLPPVREWSSLFASLN